MDRVEKILDSVLKMDFVELSFSDISVYRPDLEENKVKKFQDQVETFFTSQTTESKEAALLVYITKCDRANLSQLKMFFDTLDLLVKNNVVSARAVCEQLLSNEKLDYKNQLFFVESFKLIKRLIGGVDYKGVREIMKGCREKANSFPSGFSTSILPQLMSVHDVLQYIFDRNACLLPAYFIITELQKQENSEMHWVRKTRSGFYGVITNLFFF
jgi:mediator of RNA polymerase II transcription subunit 23